MRALKMACLCALAWLLASCGGDSEVLAADTPAGSDDVAKGRQPIVLGSPPPRDQIPAAMDRAPRSAGGSGAEHARAAKDKPRPGNAAFPIQTVPSSTETQSSKGIPLSAGTKDKGQGAPRSFAPKHQALRQAIERAVANGMQQATQRSKSRVTSANCQVAIHAIDLADGQEYVARLADASLLPASNLKLITLAAAFAELGAEHVIRTPFEAAGEIAAGVLRGNLVARAAGDPLYLVDGDGSLGPWARDLAQQLRAVGIDGIEGDLVLDEGRFLEPGPGPSWPNSRDHWQEYCALAGGFSANAGCLTALVQSTQVGALAEVRLMPEGSGLSRVGEVQTVARGKRLNVAVGARPGRATVRGTIPRDVPRYVARFAAPDPVGLFGSSLRHALEQEGIGIQGVVRRERGAPGGPVVAYLRSALADCAVPILRDSNNSVADQVFFHLAHVSGRTPDRAGGRAAVAAALERIGVAPAGLVQVDGSGLSKANRTSPRQLTALVAAAMSAPGAEILASSMPLAGVSGKLKRRMAKGAAKGRVRAKTGFVHGASGLSGLVETLDGRTLAFSILINYPHFDGLNTHAFKPMQDAICEALVESK